MTHPGKAALHRLTLLRTEKIGETGIALGSILDYVATLEAEIDQLRAAPPAANDATRRSVPQIDTFSTYNGY